MYTELNMKIWIMEGSHTYQSLSVSRNRSRSSNVPHPKKNLSTKENLQVTFL